MTAPPNAGRLSPASAPALSSEQIATNWDLVAEEYNARIDPVTSAYAPEALQLAGDVAGHVVLDVAAGSGALSVLAARAGGRVLATDFSEKMVELLRARSAGEGLDMDVRVMDGQALELDESTTDVAFSLFGVMMFPDRARGFREMHRVLRPGGRAVLSAWGPLQESRWMAFMMGTMQRAFPNAPPTEPPSFAQLADADRFRAEMTAAGFHDVVVHKVVKEHVFPDAATAWAAMTQANPSMPAMRDRMGDAALAHLARTADEVGATMLSSDGKLRLTAPANIAVGVKH